jgi:uncharacterized protein (TIGR02466 family)
MIINNEARLYELFPQLVIAASINRDFTQEELSFAEECSKETRANAYNLRSENSSVLEHESMVEIKKFILHNVNLYMKNILLPQEKIDLYVTQSWFNYSGSNCAHHKHFHSNSILSGVLYIKAIDGEDKIKFHKDEKAQIAIPTYAPTRFNSEMCDIDVETGTLLIFSSTLTHSVDQIRSDREDTRVSLAFNTFAKGLLGSEHNLTLLEL